MPLGQPLQRRPSRTVADHGQAPPARPAGAARSAPRPSAPAVSPPTAVHNAQAAAHGGSPAAAQRRIVVRRREALQIDAERHPGHVRGAEPAELLGRERRGADDLVVRAGRCAALSRSAIRRPGSHAGTNISTSAPRFSCDTITLGTPWARAQSPVQRSVARSDTSSRSGRRWPGAAPPAAGRAAPDRVLLDRRRLARLLTNLRPDRLEVSDRATLRWTGNWALAQGGSVMVSHETSARWWRFRAAWLPGRRIADRSMRPPPGRTTRWSAPRRSRPRSSAGSAPRTWPGWRSASIWSASRRSTTIRRCAARWRTTVSCCLCIVDGCRRRNGRSARRGVDRAAPAGRAGVLAVVGDGPRRAALERLAEGHPGVSRLRGRAGSVARLSRRPTWRGPGPLETFGWRPWRRSRAVRVVAAEVRWGGDRRGRRGGLR